MKRAAIHTLGCRLNQAESGMIADKLREEGYELVPFGESADLAVVNTCTVTREADAKSRQMVRKFIRKNPDSYVAVIGCYSQVGYKSLAEIEGVDLIVGNQEKLNVLEYVRQGKNKAPLVVRDHIVRDDFTIEPTGGAGLSTRANLKVQDGCSFMCSFCIIPFARGRARARDFENMLGEARLHARNGVRELVLTGVNIGTYTHEGRDIADVVDALNAVEGIERIRISSIEPTTIPERILEAMADPRHALVPYLHIPLQSGSDRVLQEMKRRYTRAEFLDFVEHAAAVVPDLCIGTDVMVGFPGETDQDFEDTRRLIADGPIHYAHVFKYSARRNTPAARMADPVAPEVAARRSAVLRRLSGSKRREFYMRHQGRPVEVLFEDCDDGHWFGYTGNYIRIAVPSQEDLANQMRTVEMETISGDVAAGRLL